MDQITWSDRPALDGPVLIVAFEGWNDAGDAASSAARHVRDRSGYERFATIDPEEFFDFTQTRPQVRLDDGDQREIEWPENAFSTVGGYGRDIIVLIGVEPQLRWPTFVRQIVHVATEMGCELVVSLGALISDVPHSRPVEIYGAGHDPAATEKLDLEPSTYEGPTGIVGVLHDACNRAGIPSASLWAAVPSYVHAAPSPKAALALVERLGRMLDLSIVTTDLEISAAAYERQVSKLVEEDDETAELVQELERRHDDFGQGGGSLVEEVEQFLRDTRDD